ncbi:polymer-forming cytoskeletal protein [Azonexus hydrophilus]|uniref:Polymer-forming cytoskeletal protein n=1 Tax=Azonexus hydrophilus TaxID=418702 RepID=A0ABZ2XM95_9RHOO
MFFKKKPVDGCVQLIPTAEQPASQPAAAPTPQKTTAIAPIPAAQSGNRVDVKQENIRSVIEEGEIVEGNLKFRFGIKLNGMVKGNIEFGIDDGMLVIYNKAVVVGNIKGPRAFILGEVHGNIYCSGRVVVAPSAKVFGDIYAGGIQLYEGSQIDGRIRSIREVVHEGQATATPPQPNVSSAQTQARPQQPQGAYAEVSPEASSIPRQVRPEQPAARHDAAQHPGQEEYAASNTVHSAKPRVTPAQAAAAAASPFFSTAANEGHDPYRFPNAANQ